MVQLDVRSGRLAGAQFVSKLLPVRVGRARDADFSLEDSGIFPLHLQIRREKCDLVCEAEPDALLSINGKPTRQAVLRSGDVIGIGALNIIFSISPARQGSLRLREALVWIGLAALCLVQIWLIYYLNR
jgi:hypothetical protein